MGAMKVLVPFFLYGDPQSWSVALVPYSKPGSKGLAGAPPGLSQPFRPSTLPRGPPRLRESEWAGLGLGPGVNGELRSAEVLGYSFTST